MIASQRLLGIVKGRLRSKVWILVQEQSCARQDCRIPETRKPRLCEC